MLCGGPRVPKGWQFFFAAFKKALGCASTPPPPVAAPLPSLCSILFYFGLVFSYIILTPAALNFFVSYGEDAVEAFWSIDQYFEFVLVLMLSTGLSFQVPVVQVCVPWGTSPWIRGLSAAKGPTAHAYAPGPSFKTEIFFSTLDCLASVAAFG